MAPPQDPWERAATLLAQDGKKQPKTKIAYGQTISAFKAWLNGRSPTEALAADWLVSKQERVSNATLQRHRAALRWLLEKALRVGLTDLPSYTIRRRLPRPLTEAQLAAVLEAATPDPLCHALTMLLYGAGLRIAEALALQVGDVYGEQGYLRVTRKGGDEGAVPVEGEVMQALRGVIMGRRAGPVLDGLGGYGGARKLLRGVGAKTGVRGLTPHRLRHSAATRLYNDGADIYAVKEFLGHRSVLSTQAYVEISPDRLRNRLPSLFAKNLQQKN